MPRDVESVGGYIDSLLFDWNDSRLQTEEWLNGNPSLRRELDLALDVAHVVFLYIPPPALVSREQDTGLCATTSEAMGATNASFLLAFGGLYPQAFHSLRQILETTVLCSYFVTSEMGTGNIRAWRAGKWRPPSFSTCLGKLGTSLTCQRHPRADIVIRTCRSLYSKLSSWTHLSQLGCNYDYFMFEDGRFRFSAKATNDWVHVLIDTIWVSTVTLISTFPSYSLALPEPAIPDAWVGPWSWTFPNPVDTDLVSRFVGEDMWEVLRTLAVSDSVGRALLKEWKRDG